MNTNKAEDTVMDILKFSLFKKDINIATDVNWQVVFEEADSHAVLPLVLQGVVDLGVQFDPGILRHWKGIALNQIAFNDYLLCKQSEITSLLTKQDIPYAILKGTSVSSCYPKSELRVMGDIDILFKQEDINVAIGLLGDLGYVDWIAGLDIHEVLSKGNIRVEPHHIVAKTPDNDAGIKIDTFMKESIKNIREASIGSYSFSVLSIAHQAIALLLHMERHITHEGLGLRQLCDWAVFIYKNGNDNCRLWEENLQPILNTFGLMRFAKAITKTCVEYLGLPLEMCKWCSDIDNRVTESIIELILKYGNMGRKHQGMHEANSIGLEKTKAYGDQRLGTTIVHNIVFISKRDFPICMERPFLFPFVMVYVSLRYLGRRLKAKSYRMSLVKVLIEAKKQNELFSSLELFKTE